MMNPIWEDLRKTADELELQMHLAGMEARDRWHALKPRLAELEQKIAREGDRASQTIAEQLSELGAALRRLRDEIVKPPARS